LEVSADTRVILTWHRDSVHLRVAQRVNYLAFSYSGKNSGKQRAKQRVARCSLACRATGSFGFLRRTRSRPLIIFWRTSGHPLSRFRCSARQYKVGSQPRESAKRILRNDPRRKLGAKRISRCPACGASCARPSRKAARGALGAPVARLFRDFGPGGGSQPSGRIR